jgi:hypothetical protein
MDTQSQLAELEALAKKLDLRVSYEPMTGMVQGIGGLCRVRGEWRVIVDRRFKTQERIQVLADALRRFDTEAFHVPPQIRRLLDAKVVPRASEATQASEAPV